MGKERPQVSMIILIRDLHLFAAVESNSVRRDFRDNHNGMNRWVCSTISSCDYFDFLPNSQIVGKPMEELFECLFKLLRFNLITGECQSQPRR